VTIIAFALAALFSILLWTVSHLFRPRFAGRDRVVMQWFFDGTPTWTAPPRVALAFTPVLGTLMCFLTAGLVAFAVPEEERGAAVSAVAVIGLMFLAIHAAHLWFAARSSVR
jgi:hypothetical protein